MSQISSVTSLCCIGTMMKALVFWIEVDVTPDLHLQHGMKPRKAPEWGLQKYLELPVQVCFSLQGPDQDLPFMILCLLARVVMRDRSWRKWSTAFTNLDGGDTDYKNCQQKLFHVRVLIKMNVNTSLRTNRRSVNSYGKVTESLTMTEVQMKVMWWFEMDKNSKDCNQWWLLSVYRLTYLINITFCCRKILLQQILLCGETDHFLIRK